MRVIRIFVSSPNDAMAERRRVSRVVERLNSSLSDTARLEAVRWEERFYSAHDGFQPQIPRSGECDIVLAVLRGRIGSPLSPAFHEALPPEEQPPAGQTYQSGTAYEILTAIRARHEGRFGDSPDIYIFRWPNPPQVSLDAPDRAEIESQWTALKRFTDDVFLTAEGQFKGAFQTYTGIDDFEAQIEALLRDWLKRHVLGDRTVLWPAERGSPFRGLEPFGMKHAAVFFGRSREIARALDQLKASASRGAPFQVVIGPSGAGKSSFLRAGLVPRLIAPGEVEGVGAWRMVLMRPGDSPEGPVAALARRLFETAAEIEAAESGRPEALPELAGGAFATPEALARQLAHADETSVAPVKAALASVAEASRKAWGAEQTEPARLLLVVDQLDEIFATAIGDEQRAAFARLLEVLGRSGVVWVVASLRAEFYEIFLKSPLAALAGDERTLTLKPPGLPEMAEIVREPALAAGLVWEVDAEGGESLDERVLADIDRPDLLPLLQFVLDRLYEKREGGGDGPMRLTFASYRALGTIDGAIRQEAERAFASLGSAEQAALPRLLRGLVVPAQSTASAVAETSAFALCPSPLSVVAPSDAAKRLVTTLVNARLLSTAQNEDAEAIVGLAHQRVIDAWDRARTIIAESAAFQRVRSGVATRRRDWELAKRPNDMLMPRGVFLAQAENIIAAYSDEIAPADLAYVQASQRHAGRAMRRAVALAGVFALVALAALASGLIAYQQRQQAEAQRLAADTERGRAEAQKAVAERERGRAERNFNLARETVDRVISDVAGGLRNVEGMRIATVTRILDRVQTAMDQLTKTAPDEPKIQRSRAAMLLEFGNTYYANGDVTAAGKAYGEAIDIDRALIARDPGAVAYRRDLASALGRLGFLDLRAGNAEAARDAYQESIKLVRVLAKSDPGDEQLQSLIGFDLGKLGELANLAGDRDGAKADYEEDVRIERGLAQRNPDNAIWQYNLSGALDLVGIERARQGDAAGARAAFEESVAIARAIVKRHPDNNAWQRELAYRLDDLGGIKFREGDSSGALAIYEEALALRRALAQRDPDNLLWQSDLPRSLARIGDVKMRMGDVAAAHASFEEALTLARALAKRDPENTGRQRDLALVLGRMGALSLRSGDKAAALAAYDEKLKIARALVARDPNNVLWKRDLAWSLDRLANAEQRAGDGAAADAARKEAAALSGTLAKQGGGDRQTEPSDASEMLDDPRRSPDNLAADPLRQSSGGQDASQPHGAPNVVARAAGPIATSQTSAAASRLVAKDAARSLPPSATPFDGTARGSPSVPQETPSYASKTGPEAAEPPTAKSTTPLALEEERVRQDRAQLARDPAAAKGQSDLALDLGKLGELKLDAGETEGALAARQEARDLRRALVKADPADLERLAKLSASEMDLAELQLRANKIAASRQSCEEALVSRRTLVDRDPGNASWRAGLALTLMRLGTLKQQVGDLTGALAAYREALGLRRTLVRNNSSNAKYQHALSVSLDRIGEIQQQLGDWSAARATHKEALELRRAAPERNADKGAQ